MYFDHYIQVFLNGCAVVTYWIWRLLTVIVNLGINLLRTTILGLKLCYIFEFWTNFLIKLEATSSVLGTLFFLFFLGGAGGRGLLPPIQITGQSIVDVVDLGIFDDE